MTCFVVRIAASDFRGNEYTYSTQGEPRNTVSTTFTRCIWMRSSNRMEGVFLASVIATIRSAVVCSKRSWIQRDTASNPRLAPLRLRTKGESHLGLISAPREAETYVDNQLVSTAVSNPDLTPLLRLKENHAVHSFEKSGGGVLWLRRPTLVETNVEVMPIGLKTLNILDPKSSKSCALPYSRQWIRLTHFPTLVWRRDRANVKLTSKTNSQSEKRRLSSCSPFLIILKRIRKNLSQIHIEIRNGGPARRRVSSTSV